MSDIELWPVNTAVSGIFRSEDNPHTIKIVVQHPQGPFIYQLNVDRELRTVEELQKHLDGKRAGMLRLAENLEKILAKAAKQVFSGHDEGKDITILIRQAMPKFEWSYLYKRAEQNFPLQPMPGSTHLGEFLLDYLDENGLNSAGQRNLLEITAKHIDREARPINRATTEFAASLPVYEDVFLAGLKIVLEHTPGSAWKLPS